MKKEESLLSLFSIGQEMLDALTMKLHLPILAGANGLSSPAYMAACGECTGGCAGDCESSCFGCPGSCEGFNR